MSGRIAVMMLAGVALAACGGGNDKARSLCAGEVSKRIENQLHRIDQKQMKVEKQEDGQLNVSGEVVIQPGTDKELKQTFSCIVNPGTDGGEPRVVNMQINW